MNAAFVARMEDVLAVYERPHDPLFPVVCFDERPCVLHSSVTGQAPGGWQRNSQQDRCKPSNPSGQLSAPGWGGSAQTASRRASPSSSSASSASLSPAGPETDGHRPAAADTAAAKS